MLYNKICEAAIMAASHISHRVKLYIVMWHKSVDNPAVTLPLALTMDLGLLRYSSASLIACSDITPMADTVSPSYIYIHMISLLIISPTL